MASWASANAGSPRGPSGPSMPNASAPGSAPSAPSAAAPGASPNCSATCMTWPIQLLTWASGMAPRKPSATWPATTATTMGMLCTWRAALSCGLASTSTLARTQAPSASPASFSSTGESCLHGPHHSAHRSTMTGTVRDLATTSVLNVSSVTSMTLPAGGPAAPAGGAWAARCLRCAAACRAPRSTAPWREKAWGCCVMPPSCPMPRIARTIGGRARRAGPGRGPICY